MFKSGDLVKIISFRTTYGLFLKEVSYREYAAYIHSLPGINVIISNAKYYKILNSSGKLEIVPKFSIVGIDE